MTWPEVLDWCGMLAIIGAYCLVSFDLVVANSCADPLPPQYNQDQATAALPEYVLLAYSGSV